MALFQAGRTGFNTSGASTLVSLLEQEPPEFPWDIGLHPPGPAGRTAYGDFGFLCIAAQSSEEKQETAWELIKYLSAPNVVVPYVDQLDRNVQTVRTDVADELDRVFGKADSAAKRLYSDFLPVVQPYRSFPQQIEASRIVVSEFEGVVRGQKSGQEAVRAAHDGINQLLG